MTEPAPPIAWHGELAAAREAAAEDDRLVLAYLWAPG